MNLRQKLYDSQDSANVLMKINNSSSLFKNLEKIQNRKPLYAKASSLKKFSRNNKESDYYLNQENKIFEKILVSITDKEVKARYNTEQNELINNNRNSRRKHLKLRNMKIGNENNFYWNRVFNQKSVISPKQYDKEFNNLVNKFNAKKKANKKLILPPIH